MDAAVFADTGEVAPRLDALSRASFLSSFGAGLRFRTEYFNSDS
jgi:hypothetical protein